MSWVLLPKSPVGPQLFSRSSYKQQLSDGSTGFADRHFYSDWWNSSDWLEFSKEWNIPVHNFLRRHVYFSSRTYFSNSTAMFITFLVSSLGHELIMGCITNKLRGYGFIAMMCQF